MICIMCFFLHIITIQIDVGTVYYEPSELYNFVQFIVLWFIIEHCFLHKWLLLTNPDEAADGGKVRTFISLGVAGNPTSY